MREVPSSILGMPQFFKYFLFLLNFLVQSKLQQALVSSFFLFPHHAASTGSSSSIHATTNNRFLSNLADYELWTAEETSTSYNKLIRQFYYTKFIYNIASSFSEGGKQHRHCDEMTSSTDLIISSVQNLLQLYPQCYM